MAECGCNAFPNGVPGSYKVTIAGIVNSSCAACASFNADFILARTGAAVTCTWEYTLPAAA